MTTSLPRTGLRGGKDATQVERDDLRELLRTVTETLDEALNITDGPERALLLERRAARIVTAGNAILTGRTMTSHIPWESALLRTQTAHDAVADGALLAVSHG